MKLSKLFVIAVLAGTLSVIGCSSDDSSSNGANGNGNGGGVDPNAECNVGICAQDTDVGRAAKAACVNEINDCLTLGESTTAQCIAFGVETCNA